MTNAPHALLDAMKDLKILVVGDLMLDEFVYGEVERISPEGPVPILAVQRTERMPGGAGNVVKNLSSLGARPVLCALTGDDSRAELLSSLCVQAGCDVSGVVRDPDRPTPVKTRYVARGQQLLRVDQEKIAALTDTLEDRLYVEIQRVLPAVSAVVLSDYGKGVLSSGLLQKIITEAQARDCPVLVDPKGRDFGKYRGADLVTPNRKELGEAAAIPMPVNGDDIVQAAQKILQSSGIKTMVVTRSEDGATLVHPKGPARHFPARARSVFDVSGAGDTVIAVLAAARAAGADWAQATELANLAGGIVVGKTGTATVRPEELRAALSSDVAGESSTMSLRASSKFMKEDALLEQIAVWKAQGLKIGLTNGCFDLLHAGHVLYLAEAAKRCDRLIVALNHDHSVRLLKGPTRPINAQDARAAVLAGLESVAAVTLFGAMTGAEDNTPSALLSRLKPDIFFKGGDYTEDQLPEAKVVRAYGGDVSIMGHLAGYSSTALLEKQKA